MTKKEKVTTLVMIGERILCDVDIENKCSLLFQKLYSSSYCQ